MIKEIVSSVQPVLALAASISTDTTTNGEIIDTANFEMGIAFILDVVTYDSGDFEFQIFESDDDAMAGATRVTTPNLLPEGATSTLSAATSAGDILSKLGVFSTKRYLQVRVVSTGTGGASVIRVITVKKGEYLPV